MKEIVIATQNKYKVREIQQILQWDNVKFLTLADLGIKDDVEETGLTLAYNAALKAKAYYELCQRPVIAEDSGFFIQALGGMPGVFSKRIYDGHDSTWANELILEHLSGVQESDREAYYEAVYVFYDGSNQVEASGRMTGFVAETITGDNGFAYDKIFIHHATGQRVSEMTDLEKNKSSHRRKGLLSLNKKLNQLNCLD